MYAILFKIKYLKIPKSPRFIHVYHSISFNLSQKGSKKLQKDILKSNCLRVHSHCRSLRCNTVFLYIILSLCCSYYNFNTPAIVLQRRQLTVLERPACAAKRCNMHETSSMPQVVFMDAAQLCYQCCL